MFGHVRTLGAALFTLAEYRSHEYYREAPSSLIRPLLVIASARRAQSGSRAAQPASVASAPLRRLSTETRSVPQWANHDDVGGRIPRAPRPSRSSFRVRRASTPEAPVASKTCQFESRTTHSHDALKSTSSEATTSAVRHEPMPNSIADSQQLLLLRGHVQRNARGSVVDV